MEKVRFQKDGKWTEKPVLNLDDEEFTLWLAPMQKVDVVFWARKFWKKLKEAKI